MGLRTSETELPIDDGEIEPHELFTECQAWKHKVINELNKKLEAAGKVEEYLTEEHNDCQTC